MSNEPTGAFAMLSKFIWGVLLLTIALWCTVQLLLQIWIYIAVAITISVFAYVAFAIIRYRRWGS